MLLFYIIYEYNNICINSNKRSKIISFCQASNYGGELDTITIEAATCFEYYKLTKGF